MTSSLLRSTPVVRSPLILRPAVAHVVAAEDLLAGVVQPLVVVGADDQRRVPVPLQDLALFGLGLDVEGFAAVAVVAVQVAVLPLAVDDVGVGGVDGGFEAVAAQESCTIRGC